MKAALDTHVLEAGSACKPSHTERVVLIHCRYRFAWCRDRALAREYGSYEPSAAEIRSGERKQHRFGRDSCCEGVLGSQKATEAPLSNIVSRPSSPFLDASGSLVRPTLNGKPDIGTDSEVVRPSRARPGADTRRSWCELSLRGRSWHALDTCNFDGRSVASARIGLAVWF